MVSLYQSPTSITSNLQGFAIWWQLFIPVLMTTSLVRHYIHKIDYFFNVFVSIMYCKYLLLVKNLHSAKMIQYIWLFSFFGH